MLAATCGAFGLGHLGTLEPISAAAQTAREGATSGDLTVVTVRPNFFMIAGAGANVGVQVGEDGVVLIDAGSAERSAEVIAAVKRITPRPIRYIIDTGPDADHVGGNEAVSKAGETLFTNTRLAGREFLGGGASILSAESVLARMTSPSGSRPAFAAGGWPTETFHYPRKYLFLNGEGIEVLHQAAAHTDGDVFVFFRRSDVVMAGDVFDTRHFPVIDVAQGGTIDGEIAALNRLTDLAIPSVPIVSREAGTLIVPGHGRVCDQLDVVEYRDMVTIIRDRVRDLVAAGRSLEEVQAAQPARGTRAGTVTNPVPGRRSTSSRRSIAASRRARHEPPAPRGHGSCPDWACRSGDVARAAARRTAACGPRIGARRPHRLLGVDGHRGLALPHGDAPEGRLPPCAGHARGGAHHQRLGSGGGRARGQSVQGLRCGRHHAGARPPARDVGRRQHHARGRRRRDADPAVPLRADTSAGRCAQLAGPVGGAVGPRAGRQRPAAASMW